MRIEDERRCVSITVTTTNKQHTRTNKRNKQTPKNKVILFRQTDGRKRDETDDFNFFSFRNPNENITHVLFCVFWKP